MIHLSVDARRQLAANIGFDSYIDHGTVQRARDVLAEPAEFEAMVEHNYAPGRKYYSYSVLRKRLQVLIDQCLKQTL